MKRGLYTNQDIIAKYRRIPFTSEKTEMWQRGCPAKGCLGIYSEGGEVGAEGERVKRGKR
jgi:hypothetical protein